MKLYHLYRREPIGHDEYDAHIIVAPSEEMARKMAADLAADEGNDAWFACGCIVIGEPIEPTPRIVLSSFNAG